MLVFHVIGNSLSWKKEQILGDMMASSRYDTQCDSRKNVRVVPLAGLVNFPSVMNIAEWWTRWEDTSSLWNDDRRIMVSLLRLRSLWTSITFLFTFVWSYACWAVHSALLVGLLSAKIKGLSLFFAISFNTSAVNAPAAADAPDKNILFFVFRKLRNCAR